MTGRGRLADRSAALAAVPLTALAVFFVYPVLGMVARGFWPDGTFDPGAVLDVLGRPRVHRVLWFTVWSAASATAVAVVAGLPVAFVLHRLRFPGRGLLQALVVVPFVLPTVVVGVAFRQLIAPSGPLGPLGLDGTAVAIIAALVFFNISVVVRTVGAFWEAIDPRREEAAAALGASPLQVLRTVTLPALLPGIASAASVVFLFCATAFGVVLTMGGLRFANIETEIYLLTTQELDLTGAAALSVLQVLVVTGLLALTARVRRNAGAVARSARRLPRPRPAHLPVLLWTGAVVVFLMAPLVSLLLASLRRGDRWGLENYRDLTTTGTRNALLVPATEGLGELTGDRHGRQRAGALAGLDRGVPGLAPRRWPSHPGPRRCVHASAGRLGGDGGLRLPDHPGPAAPRPAHLLGADPDRAGHGRPSAGGPHDRACAGIHRRPAATGGGVPGGGTPEGAADGRPARSPGAACSPRPGSRSRCRSGSSVPPASWPGTTTPPSRS